MKCRKYREILGIVILILAMVVNLAGCGVVVMEPLEEELQAANQGDAGLEEGMAAPAKLRPQDDFYGYVNQEYFASMDVKYTDMGSGYITDMDQTVAEELCRMVTGIASSDEQYAPGSNEQLVRDAYLQLMEYFDAGECSAARHFEEVAAKIRSVKDMEELKEVMHYLAVEEGVVTYFGACVEDDYYDGSAYAVSLLMKRDFAGIDLEDIYRQDESRQNVKSFALNALEAVGEDRGSIRDKADELVYFVLDITTHTDFELLEAANPYLALDFHSNQETDALLTNVTAQELSEIYGLDNPYGGWVVEDEQQAAYMSELFNAENLEVLKSWLICEVMFAWKEFLAGDYPFLQLAIESGYASEEMRAVELLANNLMPEQMSELYAQYYYSEEMDRQLRRMYDDIVKSYRELMQGADWLTQDTRDRLVRKLENMKMVCGAGTLHEINAKDAELIGADAFETARNLRLHEQEAERGKIGKPVDKEAMRMPSFVVNAKYNLNNSFNICTGIMHSPFFDLNADYEENLGGLGMIMAHEIGHAFDSNCIDYDENGAYDPDGICRQDREVLQERLHQMEEYYSGFSVMGIYYVDGVKTSGENYADKGAMECIMNIIQAPEGKKKAMMSYARLFAVYTTDDYVIDQLVTDEHAPAEIRCNAVFASTDDFYELFDVQPGDGMYVPPEKRVSRY